jgi:hypothetical protein
MAGAVAAAALVAGALLEPAMRFAPRLLLALVRLVLGLAMRACLWVAGAAAAAALLYLAYKLAVMVHAVFTYKDESLAIQHDCYTPDDYDHRPDVQQVRLPWLAGRPRGAAARRAPAGCSCEACAPATPALPPAPPSLPGQPVTPSCLTAGALHMHTGQWTHLPAAL